MACDNESMLHADIMEDVEWGLDLDDGDKIDLDGLLDPGSSFESDANVAVQRKIEVPTIPTCESNAKDAGKKRKLAIAKGPSRRKHKKKNGLPKRPLSAYNVFFSEERVRLYEESVGRLSFEELGKQVGQRWRNLTAVQRKKYEDLAELEVDRYRKERDKYEDARRKRMASNAMAVEKDLRKSPSPVALSRVAQSNAPEIPWMPPSLPSSSAATYASQAGNPFLECGSYQALYQPVPAPSYAQAPGAAGMTAVPTSSSPVPYGVDPARLDAYSLRPGMEILLPGQSGGEVTYKVQFACHRMKRSEADSYMRNFSDYLAQYGRPAPPR